MIQSNWWSRRKTLSKFSALGLAAVAGQARAAAPVHLDLETPQGNLDGFLKTRSDIGGQLSLSWNSGLIYSNIPGQRARALLLGQTVKATRCIKDAKGYTFLQRECLIFSDRATGTPLKTWFNPFTERTVEVFQLQNASVSSHYDLNGPNGPYHMTYVEHTGDVTFYSDLFYSSPSELSLPEYAPYSGSNLYEGAGLYHYQCKRADLDNPDLTSAPSTYSHTGIRQWLPWMEMGSWVGHLVLPSRGKKLANGAADVPRAFRTWIEKNAPEYLESPTLNQGDERRNFYGEFKKYIDAKRASAKK